MSSQSRLPSRRLPGSGKARPMSMFVSSSDLSKQVSDAADGDSQEEGSSGSQSTSKQSKRHSLLPQFSRKVSGKDKEKEKVHVPATKEEETGEEDARSDAASGAAAAADRQAMPPPPKPSRPMSMMRAPGIGIPGRTTSLRSHTRKGSKADEAPAADPVKAARPVSMLVKADSTLKRAGSTRLPTSPPRRGASATATAQQATSSHNRTRTSSSSTASALPEKRPSVSSTKNPAVVGGAHAHTPFQTSPPSPTGSATARPGSKSQLPSAGLRPAFNTFQQHYSPAKNTLPKPPVPGSKSASHPGTASSGTAAAAVDEVPLTYDVARDQLELLLLALAHQQSAPAQRAFEASAKQALARRHARLYKDFAALRAREAAHRRAANLAALETWCAEPALLAEHLATLARVVGELVALTERGDDGHEGGYSDGSGNGSGGRYSEMVAAFERWMAEAEPLLLDSATAAATASEASSGRRTSSAKIGSGSGGGGGFVAGLPDTFRATRTALALKLRAIQHDLSILPPCPPPSDYENASSLEILVRNCSSLADGMLKELDVMTKLEKEVLQREKARVNEQVDALLLRRSEQADAAQEKWVPAWQAVA